ncbi:hypothetical protein UVI_02044190 [Ustilaginoidea virens]|uniref:Uncharacterized protein n=1 Tax=Ustilaginoidea virens TaxID=1159556 RepID=A0A1B5L7V8_USTVR|nr:hypothetical protein UVI_02044190 [Ustilaginoidea virens]
MQDVDGGAAIFVHRQGLRGHWGGVEVQQAGWSVMKYDGDGGGLSGGSRLEKGYVTADDALETVGDHYSLAVEVVNPILALAATLIWTRVSVVNGSPLGGIWTAEDESDVARMSIDVFGCGVGVGGVGGVGGGVGGNAGRGASLDAGASWSRLRVSSLELSAEIRCPSWFSFDEAKQQSGSVPFAFWQTRAMSGPAAHDCDYAVMAGQDLAGGLFGPGNGVSGRQARGLCGRARRGGGGGGLRCGVESGLRSGLESDGGCRESRCCRILYGGGVTRGWGFGGLS